jgi:hypothetical protein
VKHPFDKLRDRTKSAGLDATAIFAGELSIHGKQLTKSDYVAGNFAGKEQMPCHAMLWLLVTG